MRVSVIVKERERERGRDIKREKARKIVCECVRVCKYVYVCVRVCNR